MLQQKGTPTPNKWAEVYDELRSHQSLASVVNDPRRGAFWEPADGIGDLFGRFWESVEDFGEQREAEAQGAADALVVTRTDALVGAVPKAADFQPYLEGFTELWDAYSRNHRVRQGRSHAAPAPGHGLEVDDAAAQTPQDSVGTTNGERLRAGVRHDPCDAHYAVPHEYFLGDFKLEQHQIFRQSLHTSVENQEELNAELTGHLDLIEVSLVEHIRRAQRDQLFDSLARLGEPLQEDLRSALSMVGGLRSSLQSVQRKQLRCGMAVGRLARRKQRLAEVVQRLDCLSHVRQSQASIEMLLQGQDYSVALELLESTKAALDSNLRGVVSARANSARLASLTGTFDRAVEADFVHHSAEAILFGESDLELRATEGLKRLCQCLTRRELLRSALGSTLRDVLLAQLKRALRNQARSTLEELVPPSAPAPAAAAPTKPSASPRLEGGTGAVTPEAAPTPPRTTSPQPSDRPGAGVNDGANETDAPSAAAARQQSDAGVPAALAALPFDRFLIFWARMLQDCVGVAERFCEYSVLIQNTARLVKDGPPRAVVATLEISSGAASVGVGDTIEPSGELLRLFEVIMTSLLQKVGLLLQTRCGDQKQCQGVRLDDWQQLLKLTNESLDKIRSNQERCKQKLSPKEPCSVADVRAGMRSVLYMQTKNVIEEFHQQRMAQLTQALHAEKWERTDVPMAYRHFLDKLIGLSDQDAAQQPCEGELPDERASDRFLRVEGINYLVVPAALTLLQILAEYLQLSRDFESLGAEIVQRMVSLLRFFNAEVRELVLKGAAVQRQTKKTINAANLALCSRCFGLVAQVLPKLQANLLASLQSSSGQGGGGALSRVVAALAEDLSKVAVEFEDHRRALLGKLSYLLCERYDVTAKKWLSSPHPQATVDWEPWCHDGTTAGATVSGPVPEDLDLCPHEALEGLVKDVNHLYKVLLKNLSGESVCTVFAKAFEDIASKFDQRLALELSATAPPYDARAGSSLGDRLLLDVAYLREHLGKHAGIGVPLHHFILELVRHLRARLPADDPLKALHPRVLAVLQQTKRLPSPE